MSEPGQTGHFTDLDGIRGVLACFVMLMHYGMNRIIEILSCGYVHGGEWGLSVDFFFALSGLVLCRSFIGRRVTLGRYFKGRVRRLAPMYMVALLAIVAMAGFVEVRVLVANLLMVQSLLGWQSLNFPSWSIPFELFLPALAVPAMPWPWRSRPPLFLGCRVPPSSWQARGEAAQSPAAPVSSRRARETLIPDRPPVREPTCAARSHAGPDRALPAIPTPRVRAPVSPPRA